MTITRNLRPGIFPGRKSFAAASAPLARYFYSEDGNNYLEKLAYGNFDVVEYTRDDQGRVTQITYGEGGAEGDTQSQTEPDTVTYAYDASGSLASVYDSESGITASYVYDLTDRLHKYLETGSGHSVMLRKLKRQSGLATRLLHVFKDADALDRIRLGGIQELDLNRLRLDMSKELTLVARHCLEQLKV